MFDAPLRYSRSRIQSTATRAHSGAVEKGRTSALPPEGRAFAPPVAGEWWLRIRCLNSVDARGHDAGLRCAIQTSNFKIVPLPTEVAEAARRQAGAGEPDHALVTADAPTGYPCRHCLQWAQLGEQVVLFPYESIPAGHPYAESGPIFVHAEKCEPYAAVEEYPASFRSGRVLRAYNRNNDMIDAVALENDQPENTIMKLLENPETAFLQARSSTRGCYTFRIERS